MLSKSVLPDEKKPEGEAQQPCDELKPFAQRAEPFAAQDEWQTHQAAHDEHAADRAKAEYAYIDKARDGRRNRRQHKQHQSGASGKTMNQADKEWPRTQPQQVAMLVRVVFTGTMKVQVYVALAVVRVHVNVQFPAAQGTTERPCSEQYQHQGDGKFHPQSYCFGNVKLENNDGQTCYEKRSRVSESPEQADERTPFDALVLAHNRRDGD
jgi:hypothetical protein